MNLLVSAEDGSVFQAQVAEDMCLQDFFALCLAELLYVREMLERRNLQQSALAAVHNGNVYSAPDMALKNVTGIRDGDMMLIVVGSVDQTKHNTAMSNSNSVSTSIARFDFSAIQVPSSSNSSRTTATFNKDNGRRTEDQKLRQLFDKLSHDTQNVQRLRQSDDPLSRSIVESNFEKFAELMRLELEERQKQQAEIQEIHNNPLSTKAQQLVLEQIHQQQINEHWEMATEHLPWSFARTTMLYIKCKINQREMQAFVDSGAQMTIMSTQFAECCGLTRLIDKRFGGKAVGVGSCNILGRIHAAQIQIGNDFLSAGCIVIDQEGMDFIIGLDLMKHHQCIIDLKDNCFVVGSTGTRTPFLPESEISTANLDHRRMRITDNVSLTTVDSSIPPSTSNATAVQNLIQMGFDRHMVEQALRITGGDSNAAVALLISQQNDKS